MVRASIPSAAVVAVVLTVFAHSLAVVAGIALHLRQYQDPNSPLLVDLPACDYYRCIVTWKHGDTVSINWINAPTGTVNLVMMINDNNDVAYQIANVSSPSQPGFCDAGKGLGVVVAGKPCGRFSFIVPTEWTTGRNYSVRARLVGNKSIESYTDVVQLRPADGKPEPYFALTTVPISGAPNRTQGCNVASSQTASATAVTSPGSSSVASSQNSSDSSNTTSPSLPSSAPPSAAASDNGTGALRASAFMSGSLAGLVGAAVLIQVGL